ncbi:hypothetical protein EXIGLDRAFT_702065 [Exidia glandulosa HHB12029]|uniref:Uncharacterized protein n=1 Tax=Exidia glandulosa HHB12029 TaxID=1314781 RepID=A0A165CR18_EXIGL|nr:hypothetical protein EXIGLDRAFT_702065 [Exidia glandulosa HHB12029]
MLDRSSRTKSNMKRRVGNPVSQGQTSKNRADNRVTQAFQLHVGDAVTHNGLRATVTAVSPHTGNVTVQFLNGGGQKVVPVNQHIAGNVSSERKEQPESGDG